MHKNFALKDDKFLLKIVTTSFSLRTDEAWWWSRRTIEKLLPSTLLSTPHNETKLLLLLSGRDFKKYALKVLVYFVPVYKLLFSFFLPTGAIKQKFGDAQMNKRWSQIRLYLNKKNCLDSKRKVHNVEGNVEWTKAWLIFVQNWNICKFACQVAVKLTKMPTEMSDSEL